EEWGRRGRGPAGKPRLRWLTVRREEGTFAVSIFATFEDTFKSLFVLIGFLPMLAGMGGNIGTQSATIVVRGLATGRFALKEIGAVLLREIRIAGILGLLYGVLLTAASLVLPDVPRRPCLLIGT